MSRLFALPFENATQRTIDKWYYIPFRELKNYVMTDGQNFFDQLIRNNFVTYNNIQNISTGQGDDYTTGCLLDYNKLKCIVIFVINMENLKESKVYIFNKNIKSFYCLQ